jgi:hypothetical protein
MLIRRVQITAFIDDQKHAFVERVLERLATSVERTISASEEQALLQFVDEQISRAAAYGFEYEDDIYQYIEYATVLGSRFDQQHVRIASVLGQMHLSAKGKLKLIGRYVLGLARENVQ